MNRNHSTGKSIEEIWELRLYVAGHTPKSMAAFTTVKKVCQEYLNGQYNLEIIDLLESPQLAKQEYIFALPHLVRKLPQPLKQLISDLSNQEKILVGLNLLTTFNSDN